MKCFFTYCPNSGFETHDTLEEAQVAAQDIINQYSEDGWDPDVTDVVMGTITHRAARTDIIRPVGEIDEEGYDYAGQYWDGEHDCMCNYEIKPLGYKE